MFCEADGPEQKTTPFRPALDTVRTAPGLFRVNLRLDTTGVHKVNCYALNKGGINARYFNNRWVEGVPAISQVGEIGSCLLIQKVKRLEFGGQGWVRFPNSLVGLLGLSITFWIL